MRIESYKFQFWNLSSSMYFLAQAEFAAHHFQTIVLGHFYVLYPHRKVQPVLQNTMLERSCRGKVSPVDQVAKRHADDMRGGVDT